MKNLTTFLLGMLSISMAFAFSGSGSGTSGDPYLITSAAQLVEVANNLTAYYKQTQDIALSGEWTPIGNTLTSYFTGTYDGNGHIITGLKITASANYRALFAYVSGTIKNLGVSGSVSNNSVGTGLLVGYNNLGTIKNCYSTGTVTTSSTNAGGLIGVTSGNVSQCYSTATVTATGASSSNIGGLIGVTNETGSEIISECYCSGNVTNNSTSIADNFTGGFIGQNTFTISNCYATGNVIGGSGNSGATGGYAGGFVGGTGANSTIANTISYCYSTGTVSAAYSGGFVGRYNQGSFTSCFFNSTTTGLSQSYGKIVSFIPSGITAKTTSEMQTTSTFTNASWDFRGETANGTNNYWDRVDYKNNKYPYLSCQYPATAPTVTTQAISIIGSISATGNGNITDFGSSNPIAHGVCWNTTGTPTISNSKTNEGAASATGAFTSSITGLSPNIMYYVRAYATNTAGTSYGNEVSFTTSIGTGLTESDASKFVCYPNPTKGIVLLKEADKNTNVKVYNSQSQLIIQTTGNQIDISSYPNGIYILDANGLKTKIIKE